MSDMSDTELKITDRIRKLLERAMHGATTPEEAASCQDKAEELMAKYRIDMAMLAAADETKVRSIIAVDVERSRFSEYSGHLNWWLRDVYTHAHCLLNDSSADNYIAVGYEEDLQYAEMLWASIQMDFVSKMMPRWKPNAPFAMNVYYLKESGKSWMEIVHEENRVMAPCEELNKNSGSRLRKAYLDWAKHLGRDPEEIKHSRNPKLWRDSFVQGFSSRLNSRLYEMRYKAEAATHTSEKAAIALQTDADRVKAFFYTMFPELDPEFLRKLKFERWLEAERKWNALSDYEKQEAIQRQIEFGRKIKKLQRRQRAPRYADMSAYAAGTRAADAIDLGGKKLPGQGPAQLG